MIEGMLLTRAVFACCVAGPYVEASPVFFCYLEREVFLNFFRRVRKPTSQTCDGSSGSVVMFLLPGWCNRSYFLDS
jgi:hypothetical protein